MFHFNHNSPPCTFSITTEWLIIWLKPVCVSVSADVFHFPFPSLPLSLSLNTQFKCTFFVLGQWDSVTALLILLHAVTSHRFLTKSMQCWLFFILLLVCLCVVFLLPPISPNVSPSLSNIVIPSHLELVGQPVSHLAVWLFTSGKVRANWAEVSPQGTERWLVKLVKVSGRGKSLKKKTNNNNSGMSNKSPFELLIVRSDCLHFGSWLLTR